MKKIQDFSVFKITDDEELIEKVLGNDDVPSPESRFLVLSVIKSNSPRLSQVEAILENYNGEFDLEDEPAYFSLADFKKIAEFEGMIARGRVNTF
jgi:hypothetical protein